MKKTITNIKRFVRKTILGYDIDTFFFSQGGEDAILQAIFQKKLHNKEKGFYVDIGAYHPYKGSNTYLLYRNKWKGINIDARPGSMKAFNRIRPRDINLEIGIGEKEAVLPYYIIGENSTMNSFSKDNLINLGMYKYVKQEIPVKISPLSVILDKYSNSFTGIDLLNVDVEGFDFEVIKSNDWSKYRPRVLIVELSCSTINDLSNNETAKYLCALDYEIIAKNVIVKNVASVFFVDKKFEY